MIGLVYVGARMHGGQVAHLYAPVTGGKLSGRAIAYAAPLDTYPVGMHTEYPGTRGAVDLAGPTRVVGGWHDARAVADWMIQHLACTLAAGQVSDEVRAHCTAIMTAHHKLDDDGRRSIVGQVVRAIAEPPE